VAAKDPWKSERCARLLAAMAAPERLQIIRILRDGPRNVTDIAEQLRTSIVNTSHHLGVLRHAGLVRNEKQGRFVLYSLAPQFFRPEGEDGATDHLDLGCCRIEMPKPEE
jgi:DNA-binding transcriptional ArsR family regulator